MGRGFHRAQKQWFIGRFNGGAIRVAGLIIAIDDGKILWGKLECFLPSRD